MSKIRYSGGGKKSSPFFNLVRKGDSLIAHFTSPRKVVEKLKKNSRDHKRVYSVSNN